MAIPLDFDEPTLMILKDGRWKTTPFYEFEMPAYYELSYFDYFYENRIHDLISEAKGSLFYLFKRQYEDFAFKPYITYNPNGGFKVSRITKNFARPDGESRTLCALPIGAVPIKNSPHGIYDRTPYAFLMHDLFHANFVYSKLLRDPEQNSLNVKKFITFIQPIRDGISEGLISDPIIDTFLFIVFYEYMYTMPSDHRDSSSLESIITALINQYNPERYIPSERYIDKNADPFFDICTSYGRDAGYYPRQSYAHCFEWLTSPMQNHYAGIRHVHVNGQEASFSCVAKRTGEITEQSPYHEYAEVVDIDLIPSEQNEDTLSAEIISQILDLKGKRYAVPTLEGKATTQSGVYNLIQKSLDRQTSASHFELERELLAAFKAKVEEFMPGALV